jgi:hypothetical protein
MSESHRPANKLGGDLTKMHSSNDNEQLEENDDVSSNEDNDNYDYQPDSPIQVS